MISMKKILNPLLGSVCLCSILLLSSFAFAQEKDPNELYAIIETEKGTLEVLLYKSVAPVTVSSFVNLVTRGYYDGLIFHRVIENFMAQGGDPEGTGSGGPGYTFEDEIILRHNDAGLLSMANSGPDTNGSQFFITHLATPHLNGLHTVFGKVVSGREIIWELNIGDNILSIIIEGRAKEFLEKRKDRVYQWNQTLDQKFPNLRPALTD